MSIQSDNASGSHLDPQTLMQVKQLELRAKMIVEGFMSGLHRSPYHGFSVEFTDYRPYSPGDDLRYLDWKLLARRDRQYIKRFEDETNLRCYLLVDMSHSMGFGTSGITKFEYARTVAATLAWFFHKQRDAVGLLTFGDSIVDMIKPRFRTGHLRRLMLALEKSTVGQSTDLGRPLEQIAQTVSKRSMIFLLSDMLAPVEQLKSKLGYLKARGHDVVLVRILDPQEVNLQLNGASTFRDMETGQEIYIDPAHAAADYQREFSQHAEQLEASCRRLGVDCFTMLTTDRFEKFLIDLVQQRSQKRGAGSRRQSPGGTS